MAELAAGRRRNMRRRLAGGSGAVVAAGAAAKHLRMVDLVAGLQVAVLWQASQAVVLGICVGFLPVAVVPLWQLAQVPCTCVWSTRRAGLNAVVVWQDSHSSVVAMCVAFLPVAVRAVVAASSSR